MKAVQQLAELFQMSDSVIEKILKEHQEGIERLDKLHDYYEGNHAILSRTVQSTVLPNNQIVANHAKYIVTMLTGYFIGNPPSYNASDKTAESAVNFTNTFYRKRHVGVHDYMLGKEASITGLAYELIYIPQNDDPDPEYNIVLPKVAKLDPRFTILFKDIDIEQTVRGGLYFIQINDDEQQVWVYTDSEVYVYMTDDVYEGDYELHTFEAREGETAPANPSPHVFGGAPIIRYDNNEINQGDFEQVITLIDAYNLLQSDRLNDKEQLVDAILLITGGKMPDGGMNQLQADRVLSLPDEGMTAEWLVKNLDEQQVDLLLKSFKKDIHEFSFTPNLTDENFAGTTSGEAMKFKLFGTEQVLQEKEVYFERGLRLRLKRIFHYISKSTDEFESSLVKIGFNHAMPTNLPDPVTMVNQLRGVVSDETLLTLLDFIEDVPGEMEKIQAQKEAESERFRSENEYPGATRVDLDEEEASDEEQDS